MRTWICVLAAVSAVGCANFGDEDGGFVSPPDAGGCGIALAITPDQPIASPTTLITVTASAPSGEQGLAYVWKVTRGAEAVTFSASPTSTGATIEFIADTPGVYTIEATPDRVCAGSARTISVLAPSSDTGFVRLRAVAPQDVAAAPLDVVFGLPPGTDSYDVGDLVIEPGVTVTAKVSGPAGGVAGYVRFSPNGMPDAMVEAFADASGTVRAGLSTQPHTVMVVPATAALAPRRFLQWTPAQPAPLVLDAGTARHGTVLDAAGSGLAGATVQLTYNGLPSTVATTDARGRFTVGMTELGATTVSVAPPASSGLARLTGAFSEDTTVRYASVELRDLAGVIVRGHGAALANTEVTIVGTLESAGTVGGASARGDVRLHARTSASGALPALTVPAKPLWLVVAGPTGATFAPLDLSVAVPAAANTLDAVPWTAVVLGHDALPLNGAVVDLAPTGPLALAGAPALQLRANAAGEIHGVTPPGAHYDLRFRDPLGRAAPLVLLDRDPATLAMHTLSAARTVHGRLRVRNAGPLAGGAVQLMCMSCDGPERARPIVEALSDATGAFTLAVPLAGTR